MKNEQIRHYLTTYAVVFIFVVFGIWEILNPTYWNSFVPQFIANFLGNVNLLVQIHGTILTALGLMLLFGYKRKIVSVFGTIIMLDIVFSIWLESGFNSLVIRDIVITLLVASLYFDDYKK